MPNTYARLTDVKALSGKATTLTTDDAAILRKVEETSRSADELLNRRFYHQTLTRYPEPENPSMRRLWLPADLVSISALDVDVSGDGTYELALVADTDYWLWPEHELPAEALDLNPNSTKLSWWPRGPRRIRITGVWGYSAETRAAGTLNGAILAAATSLSVDGTVDISAGDTLILGSEQMHVTAFASSAATVERGINGTTAADHADNTAITRRVFPVRLREAVAEEAMRLWRQGQAGGETAGYPPASNEWSGREAFGFRIAGRPTGPLARLIPEFRKVML